MSGKFIFSTLLFAGLMVARVASISLTISPDRVRTSVEPQTVTFTCTADSALTECQFRWWDWYRQQGPLLELSRGPLSQANSAHLESWLTGYSYNGRGLGTGDCGVSLEVNNNKLWMVACRVRAETGGWTYAWADLYTHRNSPLPHTLTPRESVVLPGGEARFALKAQVPVSHCYFFPPGLHLDFSQGAESSDSTARHRYLGDGLGGGDCGLAVSNVSEADNGPVRCQIDNAELPHKYDLRYMALIVASPPGPPTLSVVYTDDNVTATCEVHKSRPVANMTWFLGDDVIRQDSLDDSPAAAQDEWRWPWTKGSIQQTVTLELQTEHYGKVLKCVVSHVTLARPLEASELISITEPVSDTTPPETTSTTARTTIETSTTPPVTTSTTARATGETSISSPCTCNDASLGPTPDPACTAASTLGLLCREYRARASQLGDTSCPGDEVDELRVREAGAAARTAELAEEQANITLEATKADELARAALAKVTFEAAKYSARAEEARARAEEARAQAEETRARADDWTRATLAKVTLEAAKSSARAEEARARKEDALATNAQEELSSGRGRRS